MQDPWRSGSGANSPFAGAAGLLQLRLLQAYLLLPKAGAFAPEHASLLRLCASALKGTSAPSGTTAAEDHVPWDCLIASLLLSPVYSFHFLPVGFVCVETSRCSIEVVICNQREGVVSKNLQQVFARL